MKFSPKIGDLVYFKWEDSCSYYDAKWQPLEDVERVLMPSFCETTGFVIAISSNFITTCAHVTLNDDRSDKDGSHIATRLRRTITEGKIIKRFK